MGWLTPWALGLLALALPLTALYFRRRAQQPRVVSSLRLWRAVQSEMPRATGLRRLRLDGSYALHLAALVLLALALAGPVVRARVHPAARVALVVDTTASMGARDPAGTRLDAARHAARAALDALPRDAEVSLVRAGCAPSLDLAASTDRDAARRALDALRVDHCGADLSRALSLAAERLRRGGTSRRVMVFTDAVTRADALPDDLPLPVEIVRVGRPLANVGLVDLDLRDDPDADPAGPRRLSVFVGLVAAHLDGPRDATLTVDRLAGATATRVAVRTLRVVNGRATATLPVALDRDDPADLLRAAVTLRGADDGQPLDDTAWAPIPSPEALPVRLVADAPGPSPWIARALRADRSLRLEVLTPAAWAALRDRPFAGLTVLHGALPAEAPAGSTLGFVRAQTTGARALGFALEAPQRAPRWTDTAPSDARVRFVGVADVHVASARPVRMDAGSVALVTSTAGVLIAARDTAAGSATLVGFDPDASDWPLRPGFVFFLRGATEHARARRQALSLEARRTGAVVRVAARGAETVRVRGEGYTRDLPVHAGVAVWSDTARTGVFTLDRGAGPERVALSLLDPTESALAPAALPWRGAVVHEADTPRFTLRSLAPWLAALALAALLAEWVAWPRPRRRVTRV